jgi:type IV secretory pathway VirB2 component (pilin)
MKPLRISPLLLLFALLVVAAPAFAGGGGGLPWETPLQTIANSLTGPVAFVISLLCLLGAGAALAFGGQMNDFLRTILIVVLVIAILVGGASLLTLLFGASGATLAMVPAPGAMLA